MTVFLLFDFDSPRWILVDVFSTREKAEDHKKELEKDKSYGWDLSIQEMVVK